MITHKIINRAITLKSHLKTVCLIVDIPQTSSGQVELCILAIGYIRTMERKKERKFQSLLFMKGRETPHLVLEMQCICTGRRVSKHSTCK